MTSSDQPRADLLFGGVAWRTSALRSTTSLVVENQVVIVGAQSIRVLQIGTGVPAWPADLPQDNGTIVSLESDAGDTSAVELSAPVIHQGRVLTCLRDPEDEGNPGGYRERLVCSDLTCGEGRTLWTRTLNELAGEGDLRLVSEAIAIPGGYCVCLERRTPPHRLRIICIRPLNGDVRWECPLGTRLYAGPSANSPQPAVPRVSLNYAGGRIFMETGTDAAVCLDRLGRLKWATVAPSVSSASRVTRASTKSRLLVDEGRVLLLGADGHSVRCLAAETGEVLWNQPLAGTAVGIARCGDRVIVSGSGLRGLEFRSGRFIWQLGSETEDDPHPAVVSGQDLLWPHESELWHVNASEGRILNRIPLTRWDLDVLTDFCLSLPTGRLLFTTPTEITAVRCGLRDGF